mgnify:CR=1 FL=1
MSHISKISIKNYRGIQDLTHDFGSEKFVVLIGRGDSGKSTILSAIYSALSPTWNQTFNDLDFYNQDTSKPIQIELTLKELPKELLRESKFGLYIQNDLTDECDYEDLYIILKLSVDDSLEPQWVVKARCGSDIDDKPISAGDRGLLAVNYITDYTDNQFAYNRQSPLYALTRAKLQEGKTIERVKSELIRSMAVSIDDEQLSPLNEPLKGLKETAEKLGLSISELKAQIDIKENPYTGNSIALHSESLPYRLQGKGSKRLMSIAIQTELTKQGGIVLVDELEQGLEPDRITTLVRILKETSYGQVFITTHSINVVLEALCHNIHLLNKDANSLCVPDSSLDSYRRSNSQAFFAKKIICCEGRTEVGFIRAIDTWVQLKYSTSLSAKGVVLVDAGGGDKMYKYAQKFRDLGFDTCVFADNDKHEELNKIVNDTKEKGINVYLCEEGNYIEKQILSELPWSSVSVIVHCPQNDFPSKKLVLPDGLIERLVEAYDESEKEDLRLEIAKLSTQKDKEWFKHIPGGEFLGSVYCDAYDDVPEDKCLKKNIKDLLHWCDIIL